MAGLSLNLGLNLSSSSIGRAGSALPALQVVGSRGEISIQEGGATTSTNVKQVGRHRFYIGNADVSEISVAYAGWFVNSTTGETSASNNCRISASVELNGVVKRFKFGGSNNGTLVAGTTMLISDPLRPSEFGLTKFDAGTMLWIKSERECSVGQKFMFHQTSSYTVPITGETYYVGATTATTQLDTAGALTTTGGWSIQAHVWLPLCILGRPLSPMMATAVYGDSVANGDGGGSGDGTGATGGGFLRRGLLNVGGFKTARVSLARSSEKAKILESSNAHRFALLQYVNHAKLVSGGNDYTDGETVQNTITRLASIRAQIKALKPDIHLEEYELWAKTNSTDSWATVANQTPRPGYEIGGAWRDVANAALEAAVGVNNLDAFIRMPPGVMVDATATDKWKAPPASTTDGTHPNATVYQDMTDANASNLETLRSNYESS